ncbi:spondin-1-like [Cochliomyia hominivorax]
MKCLQILFILLFIIPEHEFVKRCSRYPSNTFTPKSPVDENFVISITGNAQHYILGQSYNVSLQAFNGHRFISAKLVLENENGEKNFHEDLGRLEVVDPIETRYSQECVNMIESTNSNPKTRLDMVWTAPVEPGNGCVLIRATVLQHRDVWFMDDGGLTKRICEEIVDDVESQKKDSQEMPCCACDEARYEITFEGLWSRNLHPKDFPARSWLTRFTDILGAAHTSDYRFWDKGVLASSEMKEFAEHGSSMGLEREFNQYFKEGKIRTIIKARGPAFPYLNSPSMASVRVDPLHHQISIASKIMPSPDWIVGVPGLELCFSNCTWLEEKVINLYPWDIGTDAGPTYTSPDQPQFPPDVIRRMSSEYPPDPRSPFFDENHMPMKPLATLTIKRQRLYERKCEDEDSNNADNIPRECYTHPWTAWSECTAECGEGRQYRTRVYKQADIAKIYNCDIMVERKQQRACFGQKCGPMDYTNFDTNQWSDMNNEEELFNAELPQMPLKTYKNRIPGAVETNEEYNADNTEFAAAGPTLKMPFRTARKPYEPFNNKPEYPIRQHLPGVIEPNEEYNTDETEFETVGPPFKTPFRVAHKPYEPFVNKPEYPIRPRLPNNVAYNNPNRPQTYMTRSLEPFNPNYIENNETDEEDEEEQLPSYNIPTEDLKQEPNEDINYTPNKPNRMSTNLKSRNSRLQPTYQPLNALQTPTNYNTQQLFRPPPQFCYQPLNIIHGCVDPKVVGNFWFYNYCTDECMLYATDICDNNRNKFTSLEQCEEHCARPMRSRPRFLRLKQAQDCRGGQLNKSY